MRSNILSRTMLALGCGGVLVALGATTWGALPEKSEAIAASVMTSAEIAIGARCTAADCALPAVEPLRLTAPPDHLGTNVATTMTEPEHIPAPTTVAASALDTVSATPQAPVEPAPVVVAAETTTKAPAVEAAAPPAASKLEDGIKAYRDGDYRAARELLAPYITEKDSAALNYVRAGFQLGEFSGNDLTLLTGLADQKNPAAARLLADIYRSGEFVPADPTKAAVLYKTAIEAGDTRSLLRLAQLYDEAGDANQAIAAYKDALVSFPEKEPRYLYLVASSTSADSSVRAHAATRLDELAATDVAAARTAFDLYRKHDVPGVGDDRMLKAAEAAYSLGAYELGLYLATACTSCTADDIETAIEKSTNFDDVNRVSSALARLARVDRPATVLATLDKLPDEKSTEVSERLTKRLGLSNPAVSLVQTRLQAAGLYKGKVDGILGRGTLSGLSKSAAMAGGSLSLTSPELFAWVVSRPISDCRSGQAPGPSGECSL